MAERSEDASWPRPRRRGKMDDIVKRLSVLLLALLGVAACGDDEPAQPAAKVPEWAKVAPEQIAEAKKHGVPVAFENDLGMRFVLIPAGTFVMGSPESEERRDDNETQHEVTISRPYYIQVSELTNRQYRHFKPDHDSRECDGRPLNGDLQPVTWVTWRDASAFAAWLSDRAANRAFRLPTEAEWEYGCRAGTTTPFSFGERLTADQANVENSVRATTGAGRYPPNGWGLYDMHGNLLEWCWDSYAREPGPSEAPRETPHEPILRGGSWHHRAWRARSACRDRWAGGANVIYGFRLVSPLPESKSVKR